jgi:histidine triad (HIT) family protein
MTDCMFCSIIAGETDARVVLAEDTVMAFLDHRPVFPGHTLVVPRAHIPTLLEVDASMLSAVMMATRRVAAAMGPALGAEGTFVAMNNVVSQSVPHLHVHVVPRRRKDGLRGFFWPRQQYESDDESVRIAEAIRANISPEAPSHS